MRVPAVQPEIDGAVLSGVAQPLPMRSICLFCRSWQRVRVSFQVTRVRRKYSLPRNESACQKISPSVLCRVDAALVVRDNYLSVKRAE